MSEPPASSCTCRLGRDAPQGQLLTLTPSPPSTQHIKAIINHGSLLLLDSDHPAIAQFIPELQVGGQRWGGVLPLILVALQEKLQEREDLRGVLPFELRAMEVLFTKMVTLFLSSRHVASVIQSSPSLPSFLFWRSGYVNLSLP